jgi:cysteine synthase
VIVETATSRPAGLTAIGNTPVARLEALAETGMAEVWVKLEASNPTGSYKDRMALAMIEGAERSGRLLPGQTVVEYTGGSTGSSLAFVCALKGYPLRIVTSDAFAAEKLATMRALGAELEVLPSPEGITPQLIPSMMERAAEIVEQVDGFATDQFRNADMVEGYRELGRELLSELGGRIDAFCAYIGTAGCFVGTARELRASLPELRRVAVEPAESPAISQGRAGTHRIEGGGAGFWPHCSNGRTSTRSAPFRPTTPSRWPAVRPGRTASSPGLPPARTSRSPSSSRGSWATASVSRLCRSTPGSST